MSVSASGELSASVVIGLIATGAYPREVVATIARGFLPLEQNDLIAVLAFLAETEDEEIAALARTSLSETPMRPMLDFAANEANDPAHLARLARVSNDNQVLELLVRNANVSDDAIIALARRGDARVQEVIVINQARILRAPEILDALLENPNLTPDARRRAFETREEFFVKKARIAEELADVLEPDLVDAPLDAIADLLERAVELGDDTSVETIPPLTEVGKKDEKEGAIWNRLQFLTVSQKVQLAFKGDRMVRMLLVRERNKLICSSVMRNPRMSDQEAEAIAGMRNVDDEVLRLLSKRRDWMGKYNIVIALIRNPKAPLGVVLPLIPRLTLRDLKGLKDDKGVQQVVREMAKKFYLAKAQKS
jgi:hypothetical protein